MESFPTPGQGRDKEEPQDEAGLNAELSAAQSNQQEGAEVNLRTPGEQLTEEELEELRKLLHEAVGTKLREDTEDSEER